VGGEDLGLRDRERGGETLEELARGQRLGGTFSIEEVKG
jgi:hypothetical protein